MLLVLLAACTPSSSPLDPTDPTDPSEPTNPTEPTGWTDPTGDTGIEGPPRILLVSLDTTRADHLGVYGDLRGLTPALDTFAQQARVYTRAHSHAPWTKPSMGTLMTSVLPRDHGVVQWQDQFAEGQVTLATTLDAAGWRTEGYVSHVAFDPVDNRFHEGFDHFQLSWRTQPGVDSPTEGVTSKHLTDLAIGALAGLQQGEEPFFLWVHYFDPHADYLHHDALMHLGDADADVYAEETAFTDQQLGRLLEVASADPGLVVAVVADHGEEFGEHGGWEHTRTVYEELIHVPLLLRAPGVTPGIDDTPVGTMDLAPTLLELVDVPAPPEFAGVSLLGDEHSPLLAETRRLWNVRGLVAWPHKVIWDLDQDRGELYDLQSDPGEQTNLWDAEPKLAQQLLGELAAAYPEVPQ